jgi:hypothetical protein
MKVSVIYGKRRNPLMILSPLIRLVNRTPFSHTAILFEDDDGAWVYESTIPVSHKIPYSNWLEHYALVESHDISPAIKYALVSKVFLNSMLGIKYSYSQLIMAGLSLMFHGVFKPKTSNGSRRLICAEFVVIFLDHVCEIDCGKPNDYVTLSDVYSMTKDIERVIP